MHNLNKDTEIYFDVYFLQIISDIYIYIFLFQIPAHIWSKRQGTIKYYILY